MRLKVLTVVGARPQFIKASAVSKALRNFDRTGYEFEEYILHTGQHYDKNMSDIFFEELNITKPHKQLEVLSNLHSEMTNQMITGVEKFVIKLKPDVVLVFGDTNSTLAASLVANRLSIPLAHVEAGLRSFNRDMPEELNRILVDKISDLLFCPR